MYPRSSSIHIDSKAKGNTTATIYSILGSIKSQFQLNSGMNTISAKSLSLGSGIYLIELETENEDAVIQKLIIK